MVHILAVDDDPEVLGTLGRALGHKNFDVTLVSSGIECLSNVEKRVPDLIILDIIMPELDGLEVCRHLRRDQRFVSLPILFLTAKGSTDDIVNGLDAGGDDYVIKPFKLAELYARVYALLRRSVRDKSEDVTIELDDLKLDAKTYQIYIGNKGIQLTSTEYRLLRFLMGNVNQVLTLSRLLQSVWGYPEDTGDPDLVRAHIRNVRAKIEKHSERKYIRTIHGVGYMFVSE